MGIGFPYTTATYQGARYEQQRHTFSHPKSNHSPCTTAGPQNAGPWQHVHKSSRPTRNRWPCTTGAPRDFPTRQPKMMSFCSMGNYLLLPTAALPNDLRALHSYKYPHPNDSHEHVHTGACPKTPRGPPENRQFYPTYIHTSSPTPDGMSFLPQLREQFLVGHHPRPLSSAWILRQRKESRLLWQK